MPSGADYISDISPVKRVFQENNDRNPGENSLGEETCHGGFYAPKECPFRAKKPYDSKLITNRKELFCSQSFSRPCLHALLARHTSRANPLRFTIRLQAEPPRQ